MIEVEKREREGEIGSFGGFRVWLKVYKYRLDGVFLLPNPTADAFEERERGKNQMK